MAKKAGKKGKMPGRFNRSEQQAPRAENPFELIHSRKKFDVLGKKQKGVAKKITKGRNEGTQKVRSHTGGTIILQAAATSSHSSIQIVHLYCIPHVHAPSPPPLPAPLTVCTHKVSMASAGLAPVYDTKFSSL